jgi:thioesterase domain-containing protein/Tfp pilus assembly protein PilF/acyl carrier protein
MVTGAMPVTQESRAPAEVLRELTAIFSRLLDGAPVDHETHFADLGGDSIQTLSLLLELEERFGLSLTPPQFAGHGSVAALAALIAAEPAEPDRLALVQPGDGRAPVFLAHAQHGPAPYAAWLAAALGVQRTVHVMRWKPPDGAPTLEAHAKPYAAAIRAVLPRGPYRLIGHSFGALLAFEVARQLADAGGQVGFLGLLDGSARLHAREVGSLARAPEGRGAEAICRYMLTAHVPEAWPGDLWLVRAEVRNVDDLPDPTLGWGSLVRGRLHLIEGAGTHGGMMSRGNVARWGERLREALDAADAAMPPPEVFAARQRDTLAWRASPGVAAATEARRAAKRGDVAGEIAAYRAAVAAKPDQPWWVWRNLAAALEATGDVPGAIEALQRAVDTEAIPIRACWTMARTLQRAGRRAEARTWIAKARGHDRDEAAVHLALGDIAAAQKQPKEAERRFRRAIELCPVHDLALARLQRCVAGQGRIAEALDLAERLAALRPREAQPLLDVARLAGRIGAHDRREAALRAILAFAPRHEEAARLLAAGALSPP